jgi:hypothetical protein
MPLPPEPASSEQDADVRTAAKETMNHALGNAFQPIGALPLWLLETSDETTRASSLSRTGKAVVVLAPVPAPFAPMTQPCFILPGDTVLIPSDPTVRPRHLDLLFFTGLAFLLCHELDAVAQAEWRLLPILSGMNDGDAYAVFVALHIPLFALVLWWTGSTALRTRRRSQCRFAPTPSVASLVENDSFTPVLHEAMFGKSASTAQTSS